MPTATLPMTEDDLLTAVIDLCRRHRVLAHHSRPAVVGRTAAGRARWATPIQGDAGLPDLVIVGRRGVLFRELKSEVGRLSKEQARWTTTLAVAGADCATWRPSMLRSGQIEAEIRAVAR